MKRLVILANAFPFGNWEPFLMTELPFLKGFDSINIMSLSVRKDQARSRRSLPDGPFTVSMIKFRSKWFYAFNAWRAACDKNFYKELRSLARSRRLSPRNVVTLLVFLTRAHYEASKVSDHLDRLGATKDDRTVFYSYRMYYQPYLASLARERFRSSVSVARAHGADLYEEHSPTRYLPLRQHTVRNLDRIFCIAEHGRQYLQEQVPSSAANTCVRRLGTVDYGTSSTPSSRARSLKVVTCSTLTPVKRINLVVEALSRTTFAVEWDHYGEGPLAQDIQQQAQLLLGSNVRATFKGFVPNKELVQRYVEDPIHVLLNVSESEGVPVSIMEALSTGTPVIATDAGGTSEIVHHDTNGFLLPVDCSADDIAKALESIYNMGDSAYSRLRASARQLWLQESQAKVCFSHFATELSDLL